MNFPQFKILITAICFISLINAADTTKAIALQINGKSFKGYYLKHTECKEYSFIGYTREKYFNIMLRSPVMYTKIVAQKRDDPEYIVSCKMPLMEILDGKDKEMRSFVNDNCYDREDDNSFTALVLCNLYISTHAQRTLSIENRSESENEVSEE